MRRIKVCGVYRIYCTINSRSYVGSSVDIHQRWSWHKAVLRRNSPSTYGLTRAHPCQEDWNLYGPSRFIFEILERCEKHELLEKEQFWMDQKEHIDRYNYDVAANGSKKMSDQTKQWMSEAAKERNARPEYNRLISDRAKEQHSSGKLGYKTWKPKLNKIPSNEELESFEETFDVDFEKGELYWKTNARNGKYHVGELAGVFRGGRSFVTFNKKSHYIDNIVWYLYSGEWPMYMLEHIDKDFNNNSISNLRVKNGEGRPRSLYPGVK